MDDFQEAAAAARSRYTAEAWAALPVHDQAQAIYAELRRIDARNVAASRARWKRRPVSRFAGAPDARSPEYAD